MLHRKNSSLVLFFDVFILSDDFTASDDYVRKGRHKLWERVAQLRTQSYYTNYREQTKLNVTKYSLASYASISWDFVYIRYELEESEFSTEFESFARSLFPSALIENARSDNASKFFAALSKLKVFGDPWIFFCPNNDHPFVGNPNEPRRFCEIATNIEFIYPEKTIGICYSHFQEATQRRIGFDSIDWGDYGNDFNRILISTESYMVVDHPRFTLDSILILRLNKILDIFERQSETHRVVRFEDLGEYYLNNSIDGLKIYSKSEWCRHYDGYPQLIDFIPPLFIPNGFFEGQVKIRIGFDDYVPGWVNINNVGPFIYNGGIKDLSHPCEVPQFWSDRIVDIRWNRQVPQRFSVAPWVSNSMPLPTRDEILVNNAVRLVKALIGIRGEPIRAAKISKIEVKEGSELGNTTSSNNRFLVIFFQSGSFLSESKEYYSGDFHISDTYSNSLISCTSDGGVVMIELS